jgi:glycosyltransferase involved in cell wall biosynthesis
MGAPVTTERRLENPAVSTADAAPVLSIVTPFLRYDPRPLVRALARTGDDVAKRVEMIVLDDGTNDEQLVADVMAAAFASPIATTLLVSPCNLGRACARNRLRAAARGRYILFLDADMIPDSDDFLARWLNVIDTHAPASAFGGFTLKQTPRLPETALHYFLANRSDCRTAADRARDPGQFTATSNLLVRADILNTVPFDEGFKGWGWEDVEWAIRAQTCGATLHVDNTATHAGLDTVDTLMRKFNEAGPNYGRLVRKHPDAAQRFNSFRAARVLNSLPGHKNLRPLMAAIARTSWAPMIVRHAAIKVYRTSIYAENLP